MKNFLTAVSLLVTALLFSQNLENQDLTMNRTLMSANNLDYYIYELNDILLVTSYNKLSQREQIINYCPSLICSKYFMRSPSALQKITLSKVLEKIDNPAYFQSIINDMYNFEIQKL